MTIGLFYYLLLFLADDVWRLEVLRLLFSFDLFELTDNLFFSLSPRFLFDDDIIDTELPLALIGIEPWTGE